MNELSIYGNKYRQSLSGTWSLESVAHAEGRVVWDENGNPRYEYALRDQLGNAHILFSDLDGDGKLTLFDDPSTDAEEVVEAYQESHYYPFNSVITPLRAAPFGMLMEGPFAPTLDIPDNYLYNTKEFNADFGLNWYDYGARWHDPAIGRWGAVDPLAEKYSPFSPYNYTLNNPVRFLDPDGMVIYLFSDKDENGEDQYNKAELVKIALAAALVDLKNGIESEYRFTTKEAIENGEVLLDQNFDMIFMAKKGGRNPGVTYGTEHKLGKGFITGEINPDHRRYLGMNDEQRLFNSGMALSHEANTHGVVRKIERLIGGGIERGEYDGHFTREGYMDSQKAQRYYLSPQSFTAEKAYKYSERVVNRANALYSLEKYYRRPGIGYSSNYSSDRKRSPSPFLPEGPVDSNVHKLWDSLYLYSSLKK